MLKSLAYISLFLIATGVAEAQMFSAGDAASRENLSTDEILSSADAGAAALQSEQEPAQISQPETGKTEADDPLSLISRAMNSKAGTVSAVEEKLETEEDIFIPEGELYRLNTPTTDGSVRGGQAFVEVDDQGRMKKVSNIFLFYDEFKISSYFGDTPGCDVRFNILSNLDRKITQLDIKLVWPGLTTTLSFSDVQPNTQTYYNYSLMGQGCYNMDKAPNIIVNRCRIKGMTASECANKLIWLSK